MKLGILLAPGESLKSLEDLGQADRLRTYYLPAYRQAFDEVIVFSYPYHFPIIRFLYLFIMPFVTRMRECGVIRVMQATSILPAVLTKWFFGAKVVATFGYDYKVFSRIEGKYIQEFLMPLYLQLLRFADTIIVTTPRLKTIAQYFSSKSTIVRIPNGVDVDAFVPAKKSKAPPWELLYVGRLAASKHIDTLMQAIAKSRFAWQIHLTCIGAGNMYEDLVKLAKALQIQVDFTGPIEHSKLPNYFAKAHLFVLVSEIEGHPKALLEALSSGLPCLVSKAAAKAVGVEHGQEAVIVAPTVLDITQGLEALLTMANRETMGEKARELAVAHYNLKKLLRAEVKLLIQGRI